MSRRAIAGLLALAALPACGAANSPSAGLAYQPPTAPPPAAVKTVIGRPFNEVRSVILEQIATAGLTPVQSDEHQLIVVWRGAAAPFVDCGSFEKQAVQGSVTIPAAQAVIDVPDLARNEGVVLRHMGLDAQLSIQLEDLGSATRVTSDVAYVVIKTVDVVDGEGELAGSNREAIGFGSGQTGEFTAGSTCQPNGALERIALLSVAGQRAADDITVLTADPEPVGTASPCRVAVAGGLKLRPTPGNCQIHARLDGWVVEQTDQVLIVSHLDGDGSIEFAGLTGLAGYLYVDLYDRQGRVHHAPGIWLPADQDGARIEGAFEAVNQAEFLTTMVFDAPLPAFREQGARWAADYLGEVEAAQAAGPQLLDLQYFAVGQ